MFNQYNLTPEEELVARDINDYTLAWLHNLRCQFILDKLRLVYDVNTPFKYVQEEAAAAGAILVLETLINEATDVKDMKQKETQSNQKGN